MDDLTVLAQALGVVPDMDVREGLMRQARSYCVLCEAAEMLEQGKTIIVMRVGKPSAIAPGNQEAARQAGELKQVIKTEGVNAANRVSRFYKDGTIEAPPYPGWRKLHRKILTG